MWRTTMRDLSSSELGCVSGGDDPLVMPTVTVTGSRPASYSQRYLDTLSEQIAGGGLHFASGPVGPFEIDPGGDGYIPNVATGVEMQSELVFGPDGNIYGVTITSSTDGYSDTDRNGMPSDGDVFFQAGE